MKYINEICNGCGKRFSEGDDIVVCPECGTPQHRECWQKENRCVNEHLHTEKFEWVPKHSEPAPVEKTEVRMRPCPFCGYENPVDAKECANCSQPFEMYGRSILPPERPINSGRNGEYSYKPPFQVENDEGENGSADKDESYMRKTAFVFNSKAYEPSVLGIETKDFAAYTRISMPSYYKKFKRFENGKKASFNFAAFFFCPFWFFFRKLYKAGIVFLALTLGLSIAFYNPLSKAMDSYSDIASQIIEYTQKEEMTDADLAAVEEKLEGFVRENMSPLYTYAGLTVAVNLVAALTADRMYKKKFLNDMRETENEADEISENRYALILRKGGISLLYPLGAYLIMQALSSLLLKVFF